MRQNVLFTALNETIQVNKILYAGPVYEIPVANRKNDHTHSIKMITRIGAVWSFFNNAETANKARATLSVMMDQVKKVLYKSQGEVVDPKEIVSYSNVCEIKSTSGKSSFGFVVTIDCIEEKHRKLWFVYSSSETAEKARKALYACMMELHGIPREPSRQAEQAIETPSEKVLSFN
ncbi:MAG TPA: hypothetical protein VHO70_12770 [Chitinispirillaceae bacterium]|nr:hypothetical protein [Chitinispirillaceae bacterium]